MLKGKIGLIALILVVLIMVCRFYNKSNQLNKDGKVVMGVVIDETTYTKNSQLSSTESRVHKYMFKVQGKSYKGNSQHSKYKVGDSILIRYLQNDPSQNSPDELTHMDLN